LKPIVQELIDGYLLTWEDSQISIEVNRIKSHSDGSVKAELVVQTTMNDCHPHLYQSMFNLLAERSRTSLANTLKTKYPKAAWPIILEQLCVNVLSRVRAGEGMEELITGDDVKRPEYLMKPLVVKYMPNIIFGDRSTAKSLTAQIISSIMLLPWQDNPLKWHSPDRMVKTLWLDWETDRDTVLWQLYRIQNGMDLPALSIQYLRMSATLTQAVESVQRYLTESQAEVVVFDSLSLACAGDLKESGPAALFWQAIRKIKTFKNEPITSLILAHTSKEQSQHKTVVGSFMFEAQARNIWECRKNDHSEEAIDVAMFHRKPPPTDRIYKPIGYRATFTEETISFVPENPRELRVFSDSLSRHDQIADALRNGSLKLEEIAEVVEATVPVVRTTLYRGKDTFLKTENGEWGLKYVP